MTTADLDELTLVDAAEAAARLGLHPGTLANWRWEGRGPRWVKLGRRAVRYRVADLKLFLAERYRETEAGA